MSETLSNQKLAFDIIPVAGRIGAEIKGVDLSPHLDQQTVDAIEKALLEYKVIFFRNQHHLDDASQEGFAKRLGELYAHPTVPVKDGTNSILKLDSSDYSARSNQWHTDVTCVDAYPKAAVLRAVVVPAKGGDTAWANTASAYQDLSDDLRHFADRLWALHTNEYDYAATYEEREEDEKALEYLRVFASNIHQTVHPVVRVHPQTGEPTLLLGNFVKKIIGFSTVDSARVFSILQDHVTRLENTVRWRWSAGDVAIWDNRATQHYAIFDYDKQHRVMHRANIAGDVPVSVDGRRSVSKSKQG